jgi:pyruvate dehydrogenase E1 component beta subunit
VRRVAGWDTVMPLPRLEQAYLPDAGRIAAAVRETMAFA